MKMNKTLHATFILLVLGVINIYGMHDQRIQLQRTKQQELQPTFYQRSMMWMPTATDVVRTGKNAVSYLVPAALPMLAEAVVPWPGGEAPAYSSTEMFETEKYVFFGPLCVGTAFVCAIGLAVCIDKCNKRTTTPVFTKAQKKRIRRNNKQLAKALERNAQPRAVASTF
jgi:hypothetical protein